MTRKTIVVGYDGEEPAGRALERAIDEARGRSARLVVVAVVEMPLNPEGPQSFGTLDDSPARMIPLVEPPEIDRLFARAREQVEAAGIEADYVWAAGEPAAEIVATARERDAALIVVGHHHHGLLGRLLGEDVANAVREEAGCEVVVVD
jgi:nucleotide-binding universal stress UspA family protein